MKLAKKEQSSSEERKLSVGLDVFSIVAINPTIHELRTLYESDVKDDDQEIVYVDEKDECDRVKICIYVKGQHSNKIGRLNFYITDKARVSKDGNKTQYINQVCENTWADNESNISNWFLNFYSKDDKSKTNPIAPKDYRVCKDGEADFYEFVRSVMKGVNFFIPDTSLSFDYKRWLRNDFSQLSILMDPEYSSDFTGMWYVRNVETDNGMKTYNEIFTKAILPREFYSKVDSLTSAYYKAKLSEITATDETFEAANLKGIKETATVHDIYGYVKSPEGLNFTKAYDTSQWEKFTSKVDGEYGCKGFYKFCPVFNYDASMDLTASNKTFAEDSADY